MFTTIAYDPAALRATAWLRKVPSLAELTPESPWVEIDPRWAGSRTRRCSPRPGRPRSSARPARHVGGQARRHRLGGGAATSGYVRATVVDAVQHGFSTFLVTDCVADRSRGPHEANLFDMTAKYADPITAEEVVVYLRQRAGIPAE